jgi:hypothetical protein
MLLMLGVSVSGLRPINLHAVPSFLAWAALATARYDLVGPSQLPSTQQPDAGKVRALEAQVALYAPETTTSASWR